MRTELQLTKLPIIAITAHAMAKNIEKNKTAKMNAHVIKPIDSEDSFTMSSQFHPH